jgi:predicted transposase/invertase (TIGR01784 family)
MSCYLDPKFDIPFKRVFAEHKHLCVSLLNALLPLPAGEIVETVEIIPGDNLPRLDGLKHSIVDLRCLDNHGRHFIVEMQIEWTALFLQRMLFNSASVFVSQLKEGQGYNELPSVYSLNLINDCCNFPEPPAEVSAAPDYRDFYHHFIVCEKNNPKNSIAGIEGVVIELPKFKPSNRGHRKLHDLWLRFMTEIRTNTPTVAPDLLENPFTGEAVKILERGAYTPEQLSKYERELDHVRTSYTLLIGKFADGEAKGRAEERAKADAELAVQRTKAEAEKQAALAAERQKAEAEKQAALAAEREKAEQEKEAALAAALAKAEAEKQAALDAEREKADAAKIAVKLELARQMEAAGMDLSHIALYTGLTPEQIKRR